MYWLFVAVSTNGDLVASLLILLPDLHKSLKPQKASWSQPSLPLSPSLVILQRAWPQSKKSFNFRGLLSRANTSTSSACLEVKSSVGWVIRVFCGIGFALDRALWHVLLTWMMDLVTYYKTLRAMDEPMTHFGGFGIASFATTFAGVLRW